MAEVTVVLTATGAGAAGAAAPRARRPRRPRLGAAALRGPSGGRRGARPRPAAAVPTAAVAPAEGRRRWLIAGDVTELPRTMTATALVG